MNMMLNVTWVVTAAVVGVLMGRLSMYRRRDEEEDQEETGEYASREKRERGRLRRGHRREEEPGGWPVGSPVTGLVMEHGEGEPPRIVIRPDGNKLYAPYGGKVTRLFPMGNAMLFATDFGVELYIQVGKTEDDLLNRYFRPKVVRNEVVAKGKLLMEFDRPGLESEGVSAEVAVYVENCGCCAVKMTAGERVKAGEEILNVQSRETEEDAPVFNRAGVAVAAMQHFF